MTISTRLLRRTSALALLALASLARAGPAARGLVRALAPGGASRGVVPTAPERNVAPRRLAKASKSKSDKAGKREAAHAEQVRNQNLGLRFEGRRTTRRVATRQED